MLTELNRITLVGISLGCTSGLVQSILENYLATKYDKQRISLNNTISKSLYLVFAYGIIMGAMGLFYAIWEPSTPEWRVNRFIFAIATWFAVTPIFNRLISWIFSQFKILSKQ